MKKKPIPGAVGKWYGARVQLDGFDLPLVRASADQFKNVGTIARQEEWKDASSALRDITDAIDFLRLMKIKREQAELDLASKISRAVLDFRKSGNIADFFEREFILCRRAEDFDYGWIDYVGTGEKVCEWRWNDLKHDQSSATVSFEFKAFDNKTTEGN